MTGLPYTYDQWGGIGGSIEALDGDVYHLQLGAGPPLVLLHSYGGNSWMFSRVIDQLAERFTVHTYDLPGCARSETPPLPYDVSDYAAVLEQVMDATELERAHLFACGGSSLTAANFAATRPQRVERLILESLIAYETREERIGWWESKFRDLVDEERLVPKDERVFYREKRNIYPELSDDERRQVFDVQDADREAHGRWWAEGLRGTQLRYDVNPFLSQILAPTLLIYAEKSWQRVEKPEFGEHMEQRLLSAIPLSRLELISETYGETFFERAQQWVDLVLGFLDE